MANQTPIEQLILELTNRARLDPAAEAALFGIDLNEGLAPNTISASSKQPLAMNDLLLNSTRGHSQRMIDLDFFAHTDPFNASTEESRATAAGYNFPVGENIAWSGTTGSVTEQMTIDLHELLFVDADIASRGHRLNILDPRFQEVGVGQITGQFTIPDGTYNTTMLTQDFGIRTTQFLTGVVFDDTAINDDFYSVGEGRGSVSVAVTGGPTTSTGVSGGYSAEVAAGAQTVTYSGGGLGAPVVVTATIGTATNAKIDLMDQSTIRTSVSVTEVSGVSTIIGLGTVGLSLTGHSGAETIRGTKGNDTLNGRGGGDNMAGGLGNDFYFVDNAGDVVTETAGQGTDRILASKNYALNEGNSIETLSTTDHGGTAAISLFGNSLANTIYGNAGVNTLDGKGGVDILVGFGGNDFFYVDSAADRAVEAAGAGADRVLTTVSFALEASSEIEVLTTANSAGAGAINLTGNALANQLLGNAGANTLDGKGGADSMQGLGGNDFFYVDNAGDRAVEAAGGGADRVLTAVSFALEAASEIEQFSTTNHAGTAAINLTGSSTANSIYGNAGANVLNGRLGNDTLVGQGGADTFLFNTALNAATNVDRITDFSVPADIIHLENAIFTALGAGALAAGAFRIGSGAADADDRIIYNSTTGALIYDSNGVTGGGATQFATLSTGLGLSSADFLVV